jgi:uncharacterized protein YggE
VNKKINMIVISLLVLFLSCSLCSNAKETTETDTKGIISVTGTASESLSPDKATIVLTIETTDKTAQNAVINNSKKAEKVVCSLKQILKPEIGESIKTSSYTLHPVYEYIENKRRNELTGYTASNQLTITTKQIKNIGSIIDKAVLDGANRIQSINFEVDKSESYCKKLLAKASVDAKDQANSIAQALGVKIVGIKQVSTNCNSEQPYPRMYAKGLMMESAAADSTTPIESGEIKLNTTVTVDFFVN